jgi:hypothetical protein
MRLVTWNCCRGAYAKKVPLLDALAADIAVVQECARPELESETCLWFGDNPRQGITVQAAPPYRLRRLPAPRRVPKYVVPIAVSGPVEFTILAVWSKAKQPYCYVEAVVKAVRMYRTLIATSPTVLMGDLNSNAIWDAEHPPKLNHSALVALLTTLGLVSAYHVFHGEVHGRETRPTYYFHWKEQRPFHIDYCFIPQGWAKNLRRVEIGAYDEWKQHSDHRPLLVEISRKRGRRRA